MQKASRVKRGNDIEEQNMAKRTDIKSARKRALKSSFGTLIIKSVWRHV